MSKNDVIGHCTLLSSEMASGMGDRHGHLGRRHASDLVFSVVSSIGAHCVCETASIDAHH